MRRILLLFLSAFLCFAANAQTYKPILTEGKVWKFRTVNALMGDRDVTVSVRGDSIIEGRIYKKVVIAYGSDSGKTNWCVPAYEENGKLYAYMYDCVEPENGERPMPILDFTMHTGDKNIHDCEVTDEDYAYVDGQKVRRIKFGTVKICDMEPVWVEGVGSNVDFFCSLVDYPTNGYSGTYMIECRDNGKLIYSKDDFLNGWGVNGISLPMVTKADNSAIYSVSGSRIAEPQKGEVYIQNGKKRVAK